MKLKIIILFLFLQPWMVGAIDISEIRELSRGYVKGEEKILAYTLISDPCVTVVFKGKKKRYCKLNDVHDLEDMSDFLSVHELNSYVKSVTFTASTSRYDLYCKINAKKESLSCKIKN